MPRYAAVIHIYLSLDSLILDTATKIALTRIIARGIARDRVPATMRLHEIRHRFSVHDELAPAEISRMQLEAEASGQPTFKPCAADLDAIHEWACMISEEDPRAFAKIPRMNLAAMWDAASAWREAKRQRDERAEKRCRELSAASLHDCPVLHMYPDGWRWVHVDTPERLDAEGMAMKHCVGDSSYDGLSGMNGIFSLRDDQGVPRVTAELNDGGLYVSYGHSNADPEEFLLPRICELDLRCGAWMHDKGSPGWADDELVEQMRHRREKRLTATPGYDRDPVMMQMVRYLDRNPEELLRVQRAVADRDGTLLFAGAIVNPALLLQRYQAMIAGRILIEPRRAADLRTQMTNAMVAIEAAMDQPPQPVRYIATMDVQHAVQGPNTPVDIMTWAVSNGLLSDRGGQGLHPYQAAEREAFEVRPWRAASVRIDPVSADTEAMIRTPSRHDDLGGQGRIGSSRPGMSVDEMLLRSMWVSGWRLTIDRIIYGSDGADCLVYEMAAAHPCDDPLFNAELGIAYNPSAHAPHDGAPKP